MIRVRDTSGLCEYCGKFKDLYVFHFESPNIVYFRILKICNDCFQLMIEEKTSFDQGEVVNNGGIHKT